MYIRFRPPPWTSTSGRPHSDSFHWQEVPCRIHEVIFSTVDKPKLLSQLAIDPVNRPAFHVRFLETKADGDEDQLLVSPASRTSLEFDNQDHLGINNRDPEHEFEPCSKMEDLSLNLRQEVPCRIHEVIFSTVDKPKLLSQRLDRTISVSLQFVVRVCETLTCISRNVVRHGSIIINRSYVAKDINFGIGARAAMLQGVNELAEAVKVIMGPKVDHFFYREPEEAKNQEEDDVKGIADYGLQGERRFEGGFGIEREDGERRFEHLELLQVTLQGCVDREECLEVAGDT